MALSVVSTMAKDDDNVALSSGSHSGQAFLGMMCPGVFTGFC